MKKILIILFFNLVMSETNVFNTKLGTCTLKIDDNSLKKSKLIQEFIINEVDNMIKKWGIVKQNPFLIYIASNEKDFYTLTKGKVPEWGIAVAQKNPDCIVIKSPYLSGISFSKLLQVASHELNHIYLNRLPKYFSIPSWYKEGLAMKQANEFNMSHRFKISFAKWNNKLFKINDLKSFHKIKTSDVTLAYAQSAAIIYALENNYNENFHELIINLMHKGYFFWDAIEKVANMDRNDLLIKLDSFINKNYNWMFLVNISKSIFVVMPFLLILGYLLKLKKNKKTLLNWEFEESLKKIDDEKY